MRRHTMNSICGRIPDNIPASIVGYECGMVEHCHFPGIRPKESGVVEGILYLDLSEEEVKRLDSYEGEGSLYIRTKVEINDYENCYVYVLHPRKQHLISSVPFII